MRPSTQRWSLAEAKAHLSQVVDRAAVAGPQVITRRGRPAAVLVSAREWSARTTPKGKLSAFFKASPLRGLQLDVERLRDAPRDLDL